MCKDDTDCMMIEIDESRCPRKTCLYGVLTGYERFGLFS